MVRIAVDCMGGDHGLATTLPACANFLKENSSGQLVLVGDEAAIRARMQALSLPFGDRATVVHASEVVGMDESPAIAMRSKKDSSMRVALDLVKEGKADACLSSGNTGALMAISRFVLKTIDGIDRPAIATLMPNRIGGSTILLDCGANVDCTPEHFLHFAQMGAALAMCLEGKENPSVGLLNIGEEAIKGNEIVKSAGELLRGSGLNFKGNVEGNDIFAGNTDVIVCDGFVGNVALKTSEGLAQMLGQFIKEEFSQNLLTKLMGLFAYPVLKHFKARVDHRRYNGASLIGLRGVVIKSHGSADPVAFGYALKRTFDAAQNHLVDKIAEGVARSNTLALAKGTLRGDPASTAMLPS